MEINKSLLRGKIYQVMGSQSALNNALGYNRNFIGRILAGKRKVKLEEIQAVAKILNLTPAERDAIFFPKYKHR